MKYSKFNIVDYLHTDEDMRAYLSAVLAEQDQELFIASLGDIVRICVLEHLPDNTRLDYQTVKQVLQSDVKPEFGIIFRILSALGIKLHCHAC